MVGRNYHAFDYLIKMEFSRDILKDILDRAFLELDKNLKTSIDETVLPPNVFINRFYYFLLNGGYHSNEQILELAESFGQDLIADSFITVSLQIQYPNNSKPASNQQYRLYFSILNCVKMSLEMHFKCYITACSHQLMGIIILLTKDENDPALWKSALLDAALLCRQYFNVKINSGIGKKVRTPLDIAHSFAAAQQALMQTNDINTIIMSNCFETSQAAIPVNRDINITGINKTLIHAIEQDDISLFHTTIEILLSNLNTSGIEQSINLISCVLHLIINCLENGEKILQEAFAFEDQELNYTILYSLKTSDALSNYLKRVDICITDTIANRINDPKYKIVLDAKKYIQNHIYDKHTLNDVAKAIGISPNYLSALFKSYNQLGFTNYVTRLKIKTAQALLAKEHLKIYQISEKLGFDNPQYFSKVFKKYTGYSPSEIAYSCDAADI
ncbi:MAG: helix-turn-helix transcriptional regulator [Anaerocolumna sp.]